MNAPRTEPVTLIDDEAAREHAEFFGKRDAWMAEALHHYDGLSLADSRREAFISELKNAWSHGRSEGVDDALKALRQGGAR